MHMYKYYLYLCLLKKPKLVYSLVCNSIRGKWAKLISESKDDDIIYIMERIEKRILVLINIKKLQIGILKFFILENENVHK